MTHAATPLVRSLAAAILFVLGLAQAPIVLAQAAKAPPANLQAELNAR